MTQPRRSAGILIVEDEFVIAMDLAIILQGAGYKVLGPVSSVAQALELLRHWRPEGALLDVVLRNGERVTPVARVLAAMEVPFMLASAQASEHLAQDEVLTGAVNVGKPVDAQALTTQLKALLAA
jgi:DNA-binding NtrC family response regulator